MVWGALFDRAAAHGVDEAAVREVLAELRAESNGNAPSGSGDGGDGSADGDGAADGGTTGDPS